MSTCNKQKYCRGCRNDFHNGNNDLGVTQCWSLKDAEVVKKRFVHINAMPPWNNKPETTLSCHHRPQFVGVAPTVTE